MSRELTCFVDASERYSTHKRVVRSPKKRRELDEFIKYLLLGNSRVTAARLSGSLADPDEMYADPYVQEELVRISSEVSDEALVSRSELILNIKSIAFDESENSSSRIAASGLLSKMLGYDAPTQVQNDVQGVMLVPMPKTPQQWEVIAEETQAKLKTDVSA